MALYWSRGCTVAIVASERGMVWQHDQMTASLLELVYWPPIKYSLQVNSSRAR